MKNISIRKAEKKDVASISKVHVDVWNTAYKEILPAEYLSGRTYEDQEKKWLKRVFNNENTKEFIFVAENKQGEIIGFSSGSLASGQYAVSGTLNTIYVLKSYQKKGIGKALFKAIVEEFIKLQAKSISVWVFAENSSRKFYEQLGGVRLGEKILKIGGKRIEEVEYGWRTISEIFE